MLEGKAVIPAENRVEWIVSDVISHLQDSQKIYLLLSPRQELFLFHHGLGRKIRNHYKFWQDKALLAEIGKEHPDDASGVIIEAVWEKLRETEAADLGFCECECVGCGESVLVAHELADGTGWDRCYDCAKRDQADDPSKTGGES